MRCCNGVGARHHTCQAIFDRTPVLPCVASRSDEGFGDCVRGAYYTTILHPSWDGSIFRVGLSGSIAQGHTRIGRITVAPLVLPDGTPYDNVFVIRHELGHLCSDALRHSMMLSGVREAHDELYELQGQGSPDEDEESPRCVLTPAAESVYRQLWRDLGIEEASYRCLADAIRRLPCADRCPRSLMEEAFADWFAMQLTPPPERIPHIFPNACFGIQDTQHLFFGTVMACLSRSPNARAYLEASLQCRRASPRPRPRQVPVHRAVRRRGRHHECSVRSAATPPRGRDFPAVLRCRVACECGPGSRRGESRGRRPAWRW